MVTPMQKIALRTGRLLSGLLHDCRGIAATEFAVIVPVMLLMFFGTIEFSSGVAVDRKMTLVARLLSDLTSQSLSVSDADITNFTITAKAELYPYDPTPLNLTITELWIDPATSNAYVQWSEPLGPGRRTPGTVVAIPSTIIAKDTAGNVVAGQYLIFSETSYLYKPTVGYVMAKAGINLKDNAYTRPRQSSCVIYPTPTSGVWPACPH
jgi:Flp pilus assembly protein TadG